MKKLLLATVVALCGADAAYASQYVAPWFEGDFSCKITGSNDMLTLSIKTDSVPNTQCNGDKCSTSGYRMIVKPQARLSSWPGGYKGTNEYHTDNYIHFYVKFNNGDLLVTLQKSHRGFKHRVAYAGTYIRNGKTWQFTCTR